MVPETDRARTPVVADAERARVRAIEAGRWFGWYLAVIGLVSAGWLVLIETAFAEGIARLLAAATWAALVVLASMWAERHAVYPKGATKYLWLAFATWFALYLLLIGPLVRWQFGDALLPWMVASALMSLPFLIAAALVLRRR